MLITNMLISKVTNMIAEMGPSTNPPLVAYKLRSTAAFLTMGGELADPPPVSYMTRKMRCQDRQGDGELLTLEQN